MPEILHHRRLEQSQRLAQPHGDREHDGGAAQHGDGLAARDEARVERNRRSGVLGHAVVSSCAGNGSCPGHRRPDGRLTQSSNDKWDRPGVRNAHAFEQHLSFRQRHQPRRQIAGEGATGTRVPIGNRGAVAAPGDPRGPPRGPLRALRDLRVPGLPYGTRVAAISVPVRSLASRSARSPEFRDHALSHLAGRRLPAIAGASPLAVVPGLLDLEPSVRLSFQAPIACHVRRTDASTSRRKRATRASSHGAVRAGISPAVGPALPSAISVNAPRGCTGCRPPPA